MKIQVLGSGCATCKTLHTTVQEVAKRLEVKSSVEYSTDITEIAKLGAMSSPVFAIDGKIISVGKVPSVQEIETALKGNSSASQQCEKQEAEKTEKKSCCCSGSVNNKEKIEDKKNEKIKGKYCPYLIIKRFFSRLFS